MTLKRIEVDHNFREHIHYRDSLFPVDICTDVYSMFVDGTVNCHWHREFEFGVVLRGQVDCALGETHLLLCEGDGVFINSNVMHMARQPAGCDDAAMFTVVFPPDFFGGNQLAPVYRKYITPILQKTISGFRFSGDTESGARLLRNLHAVYRLQEEQFGYELTCLSLLSAIWNDALCCMSSSGLSLPGEAHTRHEQRARQMLSFIHQSYAEHITVDDIARAASVSRSECFRCFKTITNKKPVEYLNEYRLARAAQLLLESRLTVSEVCAACGFSNSSYFGKLFHERCGVSPGQFRRSGALRPAGR